MAHSAARYHTVPTSLGKTTKRLPLFTCFSQKQRIMNICYKLPSINEVIVPVKTPTKNRLGRQCFTL